MKIELKRKISQIYSKKQLESLDKFNSTLLV